MFCLLIKVHVEIKKAPIRSNSSKVNNFKNTVETSGSVMIGETSLTMVPRAKDADPLFWSMVALLAQSSSLHEVEGVPAKCALFSATLMESGRTPRGGAFQHLTTAQSTKVTEFAANP